MSFVPQGVKEKAAGRDKAVRGGGDDGRKRCTHGKIPTKCCDKACRGSGTCFKERGLAFDSKERPVCKCGQDPRCGSGICPHGKYWIRCKDGCAALQPEQRKQAKADALARV